MADAAEDRPLVSRRAEVRRLKQEGRYLNEIAGELGVSLSTVQKASAAARAEDRERRQQVIDEELRQERNRGPEPV